MSTPQYIRPFIPVPENTPDRFTNDAVPVKLFLSYVPGNRIAQLLLSPPDDV